MNICTKFYLPAVKLRYGPLTKDPILLKDTGLVPVMHVRGTSGSAMRICCIGVIEQVGKIG